MRKEFTHNHEMYHGEYLHGLAIAVNTIPDRCLSFQVVFTGVNEEENVTGGAMWARMPITSLVADEVLEEWPERMDTHLAQPWDCSSRGHSIIVMDRISSSPWYCKIDGEFYNDIYDIKNESEKHEKVIKNCWDLQKNKLIPRGRPECINCIVGHLFISR